jgi:hypothetical protein
MSNLPRTPRRGAIAYLLVLRFATGAQRFDLEQTLGGALFPGLTGGALPALNADRHDPDEPDLPLAGRRHKNATNPDLPVI